MKFKIYTDRKKEWRWRLIATNGRIIADSGEGYTRKDRCKEAVLNMITRIKNQSQVKIEI